MLIQWIHTVGTWLKTMVIPFMLLISCESCVCWSCRTSTGNINKSYRIVSSWNPEILEWSRGDRCAAVCRAYFTGLAFAPPKESPITPDPSRIVERVLLEKLSQPYKPVSFLIRALLCLIISYPTSSTCSLFRLFILLTTSALGFVMFCRCFFHAFPIDPQSSWATIFPESSISCSILYFWRRSCQKMLRVI